MAAPDTLTDSHTGDAEPSLRHKEADVVRNRGDQATISFPEEVTFDGER